MSRIIRAEVISNSSEDKYSRVKLRAEGLWSETPLVESIGGIPLKKGDFVFVDVTKVENPIILGRAMHSNSNWSSAVEGSILFESSNGSKWTIAFVKDNKLEIINSDGGSLVIDSDCITIKDINIVLHGAVKVTGTSLEVDGVTQPGTSGPFNCLNSCTFTGVPHAGTKVAIR